jgi:hypothetical protein
MILFAPARTDYGNGCVEFTCTPEFDGRMQFRHLLLNQSRDPIHVFRREVDVRHAFERCYITPQTSDRVIIRFQVMFLAGNNESALTRLSVFYCRYQLPELIDPIAPEFFTGLGL